MRRRFSAGFTSGTFEPRSRKGKLVTAVKHGAQFCGSYPNKDGYCREIIDAGNGVYHAVDNGEHLRAFSNFRDGNQL